MGRIYAGGLACRYAADMGVGVITFWIFWRLNSVIALDCLIGVSFSRSTSLVSFTNFLNSSRNFT